MKTIAVSNRVVFFLLLVGVLCTAAWMAFIFPKVIELIGDQR